MISTRPFSGTQFQISSGPVTAQVGEVAAVLRSFAVDGVPFTETWDDATVPPMGAGIVLVPWPNRIPGGQWTLRGKQQQLDITDVGARRGDPRPAAEHAVPAGRPRRKLR